MNVEGTDKSSTTRGGANVFRLAAMSTGLRVLTWALFGVPVLLFYVAWRAPAFADRALWATAVFVAFGYASVWFVWRPSRFEIEGRFLRIVWPLWSRSISRTTIEDARIVDAAAFRREFGYGIRIGAGGLWGGFGLLKTHTATFSMWVSRTDRFVLVRLRGARPLLVTPERPEEFVEALSL
jgi:hypothetical protein